MQVIDAVAFKNKTTPFQIFRMAESASVPLQLQSVALLRGGFKRFVRARGEEEKEENCENEVTAVSGDVVKNIYEEIIASPSTPMAKRKKNTEKHETVKTEEVIALSDTDDDLEMVDTSANMELLVAVQQVGLVNLFEADSNQNAFSQGDLSAAKRVRFCDYNCTDSYGWTPLEIAAVLGHAPLVRCGVKHFYLCFDFSIQVAANKRGLYQKQQKSVRSTDKEKPQ